jgi:hypothetical protein
VRSRGHAHFGSIAVLGDWPCFVLKLDERRSE